MNRWDSNARCTFLVPHIVGMIAVATFTLVAGSARADQPKSEEGVRSGKTFVIAAIGDSLTSGFNAVYPLDNREYSWSTGYATDGLVQSHFLRLRSRFPSVRVEALNHAVPGTKANSLYAQALTIVLRRPDYVTIEIGANDACRTSGDALGESRAVGRNVRQTIDLLIATRADVKILLVPIVNLRDVYTIVSVNHQCKPLIDVRRFFCSTLLSPDASPQSVNDVLAARDALNDEFATIAAEFPANVRFAETVVTSHIRPEQLSQIDCFHPGASGQNDLSEATWADGWFSP